MNIQDAIYEFAKQEVIPMIAKKSELTAGILNGVLRAGRKKITVKLSDNSTLKAIGIVDEEGNIDKDILEDFFEGVFEQKQTVSVTLADLLKAATGIESDNDLLQDMLSFTKADAENFLNLLSK